MPKDPRTVLEQLEDILLRAVPGVGGMICGLITVFLTRHGNGLVIVRFTIGAMIGGSLLFAGLKLLFQTINPDRDRP